MKLPNLVFNGQQVFSSEALSLFKNQINLIKIKRIRFKSNKSDLFDFLKINHDFVQPCPQYCRHVSLNDFQYFTFSTIVISENCRDK